MTDVVEAVRVIGERQLVVKENGAWRWIKSDHPWTLDRQVDRSGGCSDSPGGPVIPSTEITSVTYRLTAPLDGFANTLINSVPEVLDRWPSRPRPT